MVRSKLKIIKNTFSYYFQAISYRPIIVYVIIALFFGGLFIFRLSPLNGTDEFTHFPRVYQIMDGQFWERSLPGKQFGGYLPSNVNLMINDYRDLSRKPNGTIYSNRKKQLNTIFSNISNVGKNKQQAIFTSVVIYPPWAYIPSLLGVATAHIFKLPLIWYVYLGRISSLLVSIILTAYAIKIIPFGKWFIVGLALLPTSLTQAATIGADGLLNGLSWLMIATVLAIFNENIKLNWKKLLLISFAAIYLAVIKDSYWLIAFLPLIIPKHYFQNYKQAWIWRIVTFSTLFTFSLWFALRTKSVVKGVVLTPILNVDINSTQQINYILTHPLNIIWMLLVQPFTKTYDTIYLGIVGILTNRLIYLSILTIGLLFSGLIIGLRRTRQSAPISPMFMRYKTWLLFVMASVVIGTYSLIAIAFYIGNTGVGSPWVNGIYGRYFLPFLPILLVLPATIKTWPVSSKKFQAFWIILVSIIGLIATINSVGWA